MAKSWKTYALDKGVTPYKAKKYWTISKTQAENKFNKDTSSFSQEEWRYVMGIFKNIISNSLQEQLQEEENKQDDAFLGYAKNQGLDNEDQAKALFSIAQNKTAKETKKEKDSFGAEEMPILWSTFKDLVQDAIDKQEDTKKMVHMCLSRDTFIESCFIKKGTNIQLQEYTWRHKDIIGFNKTNPDHIKLQEFLDQFSKVFTYKKLLPIKNLFYKESYKDDNISLYLEDIEVPNLDAIISYFLEDQFFLVKFQDGAINSMGWSDIDWISDVVGKDFKECKDDIATIIDKAQELYTTEGTIVENCKKSTSIQESTNYVAEEILHQLGGSNKLKIMIGAYDFISSSTGLGALHFKFKAQAANKSNFCKIILNENDTYSMELGRIYGKQYKVISTFNELYVGDLKELFEQETNLDLTL